MQMIKSPKKRSMWFMSIFILLLVVLSLAFVFFLSAYANANEKKLILPTDPAWSYTNGRWKKTEVKDWGEVMQGSHIGTRAHIETNGSFAILKKRGNGDEITVFVDGNPVLTHKVPNDGKEYEIPIYTDSKGWHHIEIASAKRNEINGLYINKGAEVRKPKDDRKRLVVIGHSYVEGCCLANPGLKSIAPLLGDLLGVESINVGIGGTDINVGGDRSGLKRVESDIISFQPDYVLSIYGFNVRTRIGGGAMTLERYQKDYTEFLKKIHESLPETKIFVSGINSLSWLSDESLKPLNQTIQNVCSSVPNCTFIDLAGKWNEENYEKYESNDGIHPSEEGYQFLAEEYAKVISTLMNNE